MIITKMRRTLFYLATLLFTSISLYAVVVHNTNAKKGIYAAVYFKDNGSWQQAGKPDFIKENEALEIQLDDPSGGQLVISTNKKPLKNVLANKQFNELAQAPIVGQEIYVSMDENGHVTFSEVGLQEGQESSFVQEHLEDIKETAEDMAQEVATSIAQTLKSKGYEYIEWLKIKIQEYIDYYLSLNPTQ